MTSPEPTVRVVDRRRGGWVRRLARLLAASAVVAASAGSMAGAAAYVRFSAELPDLPPFDSVLEQRPTRVLAADGRAAAEVARERRVSLRFEQVPERLALAFLAAEDARFFDHHGVDWLGVARAVVTNLRAGRMAEGASTVTQQLAKVLVGRERTLARKAKQAILARRMEAVYTKPQILTWYLNAIYLGHGSYGVQQAARNYFRKDVWELSLAECAMLGGLPQSPSRVNPVVAPEAARERMRHVLQQMRRRGWIDDDAHAEALATPTPVFPRETPLMTTVPGYVGAVRGALEAELGDEARAAAEAAGRDPGGASWLDLGATIELAVGTGLQRAAADALMEGLEALARRQGYRGALGQLDLETYRRRAAGFAPASARWQAGARTTAWVRSVSKREASLVLPGGAAATLALSDARWATPYHEPAKATGGELNRRAEASLDGRLDRLDGALSPGDVVWVTVTAASPDALGGAEGPEAADGRPARARVDVALTPVPRVEGAMVSASLAAGGLDTLVGSWDPERSQVHRAYALRQTGSTMKPIVYGKAYDLGLPPSALMSGAPFREGGWSPTGARTRDDRLVWDALARSENAVSLRVLQDVRLRTSLGDYRAWGRSLGLGRGLLGNPAEVLGADQTPRDLTHAYGVLANRGHAPRMHRVRRVVDRDGRVLVRRHGPGDPHAALPDAWVALEHAIAEGPPAARIPPTTAWLVTANLREVVRRGTATAAKALGRDLAGKTGTLPYDVWFAGYSASRVTTAWVGQDRRRRPLGRSVAKGDVYGADTALPPWMAFMAAAESGRPGAPLLEPRPADVVDVRIDPATGLRARRGGVLVPHRHGTEPSALTPDPMGPGRLGDVEHTF